MCIRDSLFNGDGLGVQHAVHAVRLKRRAEGDVRVFAAERLARQRKRVPDARERHRQHAALAAHGLSLIHISARFSARPRSKYIIELKFPDADGVVFLHAHLHKPVDDTGIHELALEILLSLIHI